MKKIIFITLFLTIYNICFSADYYWAGYSDNNWSNPDNWDDGYTGAAGAYTTPPGSSDDVHFDDNVPMTNPNCTIDGSVTIISLTIHSNYTGIITQSNPLISIGTITIDGGTFTQSNTITAGGTLSIGINFSQTNTITINGAFTITAGTFSNSSSFPLTVTTDLTISGGTFTQGSNLTVTGNLIISGGIFTQAVGKTVVINGTGNGLQISLGTFSGATSGNITCAGSFYQTGGTFTSTQGTFTVRRDFTSTIGTFNYSSSATAGTVTINYGASPAGSATHSIYGTPIFYNLTFQTYSSGNDSYILYIDNTSTGITVKNTFSLTTGIASSTRSININNGIINCEGNISYAGISTSTNSGGTGTLNISGGNNQNFTGRANAGEAKFPKIKINKSGNTLTFASNLSLANDFTYIAGTVSAGAFAVYPYGAMNLDGQGTSATMSFNNIDIKSGTVTLAGNLDVNGSLTISGGTLDASSYTITNAGDFSNSGTFTPSTSTFTFDGATATLAGTATLFTFNNLTIGAGCTFTIPKNIAVTVSSTLTNTDNNAARIVVNGGSGSQSGSLLFNTNSVKGTFKSSIATSKWHCISSPISDADLSLFNDVATNNLRTFNEADVTGTVDGYWPPVAPVSGAMTAGKGYYIFYNFNKLKSYAGTFNNGDVTYATTYTAAPGRAGWNHVGNPYPCALDWTYTAGFDRSKINGSAYVKTGTTWYSHNGTTGDAAASTIYPGQGFFVIANSGGGNFTIHNTAKTHYLAGTLLKSVSPDPLLTLQITDAGNNGSSTYFQFNPQGTEAFDNQFDAYKRFADDALLPEMFTVAPDTLSINCLPLVTAAKVIPVGIKTSAAGTYTIQATKLTNFDPSLNIYLEDIETNTITDLKVNPIYTFIVSETSIRSTSRFNLRFAISTPPQILAQTASMVKCAGESAVLSVTPNNAPDIAYQWFKTEGPITGENSNTLTLNNVTTADANDYYCVITNTYGTVQSTPATLSITTAAQISQSPASVTKCETENTSLAVVATGSNLSYQWQKNGQDIANETTETIHFQDLGSSDNGNYTCIVTNSCNTITSTAATISVNVYPIVNLGANQNVCEGTNVTLDAGNIGATYLWNTNSTDAACSVSSSGTYSVAVTKNNCTTNASVDITVNPMPIVNLGANQTVCEGTNVTLDAGNIGATYLWSNNSTDAACSVSATGTYSVAVTKNNCTTNASVDITVNPMPIVNLGANQTVCEGTNVTLNAGNIGATYLWSNNSTDAACNVSSSGTYSVAVTKNNCTSNASVDITVNPMPIVNLGNDISVCAGTNVTLNAGNAGATYLWSNNSTDAACSVSATGIYSVAVTKNNCTTTDEIQVTINEYPIVNIGNNQSVCEGTTVTLNAGNAGMTYSWSNGSSAQQLNVTTSDIYEVTVSNNGCTASDYVSINIKPTPVVNLGQDITICSGNEITLDAGYITGNSYSWSTDSHNQIIHPTTSGAYAVTVTNNGCIGTDNLNITINQKPVVNLGNDQIVCESTNIILNAGVASSYLWSTGETTQQITVNNSGIYNVSVLENGCEGFDQISITVKPSPVIDLGQDINVCEGTNVVLDAGYITGNSYNWSNGSHNQVTNINTSGNYIVTVTNNGCSSTDAIQVDINDNPVVDLGADQSICQSCSVTLDAGNAGATFVWSTGATTQTIDVTSIGTYSVTVTNGNCTATDDIIVDLSTSIAQSSNGFDISVYPNPAKDNVNIATTLSGNFVIDVIDVTGKNIMSVNTDKNQSNIDISALEKGIYLIRISNSEKVYIKTIVKD